MIWKSNYKTALWAVQLEYSWWFLRRLETVVLWCVWLRKNNNHLIFVYFIFNFNLNINMWIFSGSCVICVYFGNLCLLWLCVYLFWHDLTFSEGVQIVLHGWCAAHLKNWYLLQQSCAFWWPIDTITQPCNFIVPPWFCQPSLRVSTHQPSLWVSAHQPSLRVSAHQPTHTQELMNCSGENTQPNYSFYWAMCQWK